MSRVNQTLQELLSPNERVRRMFKEGRESMSLSVYMRQIMDIDREDLLKILAESVKLEEPEASS